METVYRTAYAAYLQNCLLLRKPFVPFPNSTLNQKFGVHADQVPATNEYPSLGYVGIGNKGNTYEVGAGGFMFTTPVPHLARHAAGYNMIPFVARHVDDDLSAAERNNYRLRVMLPPIGGENHVAYFLRKLDLNSVVPSIELRNVSNGVITNSPFVPELSDLSPTHPVLTNPNMITADGDYLVATAKTEFVLNQSDITNIIEACNLIYGDPRYAVISEAMLVTGLDKPLTGTFGGTTSTYTEVVAAQVAAFISQSHNLTASTTEVRIALNVGGVEPLLT